ncbi:MAG: nitroreductase family protein [Gemmiger sp.]
MENMMEFLQTRRTYRRFEQRAVEPAIAQEILEAARIASCGANRQTLKYVLVQSPEMVEKMQPLVHWAAFLPPEQGTPAPNERPVMFIAVCQDERMPGVNDTDAGLALGSMTAAAWAHGVGSCIMGAIDRPAICSLLGIGEGLRLHSVVAFGYPTHTSRVVEMKDGSVKYYLDEDRNYCVPKRPMEDILLKTV